MSKIMVAEDEKDIRDLVVFTLRFAGFDVVAAPNGDIAEQMVMDEMPELVLLDVRMPGKSGYEVCKNIKANPKTRHIPVIFLTAKGQEAEIRAGMQAGAAEYLLKPFAPDELTRRVKSVLGMG